MESLLLSNYGAKSPSPYSSSSPSRDKNVTRSRASDQCIKSALELSFIFITATSTHPLSVGESEKESKSSRCVAAARMGIRACVASSHMQLQLRIRSRSVPPLSPFFAPQFGRPFQSRPRQGREEEEGILSLSPSPPLHLFSRFIPLWQLMELQLQ